MSKTPYRLVRVAILAGAIACLMAVALFPGCQSAGSPVSAAGGGDFYQADPAFPDSADSSQAPPQDPIPDLDDPTQPHP